MKYYKGDIVYLTQTGETAVVTRADNEDIIYVEAEGMEIPVFTSDISKEFPKELLSDIQKENDSSVETASAKNAGQMEETGLFICLAPQEHQSEITGFDIYLVNGFNEELQFEFQFLYGRKEVFSLKKNITLRHFLLLYSIDYDGLNESPSFHLEVKRKNTEKKAKSFNQKIKPNNLFNKKRKLSFLAEDVFAYLLLDEWTETVTTPDEIRAKRLKEIEENILRKISSNEPRKKKKGYEPPAHEIDLHIERLLPDHRGMSNTEIIQFQLKCFRNALEKAISGGVEKFYVIHGIGKGKLKEEIFRILPEYPQVKSFKNEYHPRYGFGATEIFLK